ncbi:hypothetical protein AK88_05265 [Plasmodium fragile]|uniref:Uncharacterized protein n=1 Tax=Plasmodium fragile TaxID=5857 RepID=A0A0D9QHC0_PLAFR|nr:uncharacterized protein AK88_05265 [Plasmodium fragile]KJP85096.1 hypothetical protein AK88_05265 [Plasmodium fragile]
MEGMNPLLEYKRIKEAVFSKHPLGLHKTLPKRENFEFKTRAKEKIKDEREDRIKHPAREDISTPNNRTALQKRSSQSFALRPRHTFQKEHIRHVDKFNDTPHGGNSSGRNEKCGRQTYAISQEENLELSLVCPDGPKSNTGMVVYKYCYICETGKPCFCSEENYDYEKNIIETIHSNKKKQEGNKINACVKGQGGKATGKKELLSKKKRQKNEQTKPLSSYDRFYLHQVKTIKGKLDCLREGRVWNEDTTAQKGAETKSKVDMDMDQNGPAMEKRMDALKEIEKKHLKLLVSLFDEYKDLEEKML